MTTERYEQEEAPDYGMSPNMSYCMFENTLRALQQAAPALFDPRHLRDLSRDERDARENLLEMVKEIGYQIEEADDAEEQREEALANAEATVQREHRTNAEAFREADERAAEKHREWVNTQQEAALARDRERAAEVARLHAQIDSATGGNVIHPESFAAYMVRCEAEKDSPADATANALRNYDEDTAEIEIDEDGDGDQYLDDEIEFEEDRDASEQDPETGLAAAQLDLFGGGA